MGSELSRWMRDEEGEGRQLDRYAPPPARTRLGLADRRREGRHVLTMRDLERKTQEGIATEASQALVALARQERLSRELDEAKFKIERAHRTSQIIAAGDPEMAAKFAVLDDGLFRQIRADLHRPRS
jgi:hypothetical protein